MEALSESWRTSSYSSGNGGNCVEAANGSGVTLVRDTTDRGGVMLTFDAAAWAAFTASLR